ncbi:MAG: hypothetical protein ACTS5I_13175 [Rhodanobacter sp.]
MLKLTCAPGKTRVGLFVFMCPMAQGVRRGVPDILWMLPACGFYGLAMELKVSKRKTTPEQADWLRWLSDRNYFTCTVYDDPGEAMGILQRYLEGAHP